MEWSVKSSSLRCLFLHLVMFSCFAHLSESCTETRNEITYRYNEVLPRLQREKIGTNPITFPMDVLFVIDRSPIMADIDPEFENTKALISNLTGQFDLTGREYQVRVGMVGLNQIYDMDLSFCNGRHQHLIDEELGRLTTRDPVSTDRREVLKHIAAVLEEEAAYGARRNVAKVVIFVVGTEVAENVYEEAHRLRSKRFTRVLAVGHNTAPLASLLTLAGSRKYLTKAEGQHTLWQWQKYVEKLFSGVLEQFKSSAIYPPKGIQISLNGDGSICMKWDKQDDLIAFYYVVYTPVKSSAPETLFEKVEIGYPEFRIRDMHAVNYNITLIAYGPAGKSEPVSLPIDIACQELHLDAVILIDISNMTREKYNLLDRQFLQYFTTSLYNLPTSRVGVMLFSDYTTSVVDLDLNIDIQGFQERISAIGERGENFRGTNNNISDLGLALEKAHAQMQETHQRQHVYKSVIVISENLPTGDYISALRALDEDNIDMFYVGVGKHSHVSVIHQLATYMTTFNKKLYLSGKGLSSSPFYSAESIEDLSSIEVDILSAICSDSFDYYHTNGEKLEAPFNFEAEHASNTSIQVSWSSTKSALVKRYEISTNANTEIFEVDSKKGSKKYRIPNLYPGQEVDISIRAVGLGHPSDYVVLTKKTQVPAPYNLKVAVLDDENITISWKSETDDCEFEIKIILLSAYQLIQQFQADNTKRNNTKVGVEIQAQMANGSSRSIISAQTLPGTRYEIQARSIFDGNITSGPARQFYASKLPAPENFRLGTAGNITATVYWESLNFRKHDRKTILRYLLKVYEHYDDGTLHAVSNNRIKNNTNLPRALTKENSQTLYKLINGLIPGRYYTAYMQAEINSELSETVSFNFSTEKVTAKMEVIVVTQLGYISQDQQDSYREFIKKFTSCFDTSSKKRVRLRLYELIGSETPVVTEEKARNTTLLMNSIDRLRPRIGIYTQDKDALKSFIKRQFTDSRNGVVRIWYLLMTTQDYRNMNFTNDDYNDLGNEGITTNIIQMASQVDNGIAEPPTYYTYVFDRYNMLLENLLLLVTNSIMADQKPLEIIGNQRGLKPQELNASQVDHEPTSPPRTTTTELSTTTQHVVHNETCSCAKKLLRTTRSLVEGEAYKIILRGLAQDGTLGFVSTRLVADKKRSRSEQAVPKMKFAEQKTVPLQRVRLPGSSRTLPNRAQSCLVSGCNVVFLVDSSDAVQENDFDDLKVWMKRLINSLSIQQTAKVVASRKRQAAAHHRPRMPPIMTYGVGLSIVQFANQSHIVLPMTTQLTKPQTNHYIDGLRLKGGPAYTGRALDFVRNHILVRNSSGQPRTRNIVVLVSTGQSRDNAILATLRLKRIGALMIELAVGKGPRLISRSVASRSPSITEFNVESFKDLESKRHKIRSSICSASRRRSRLFGAPGLRVSCPNCPNGIRPNSRKIARGPIGPKGERGIAGRMGDHGKPGLPGPRGLPGPPGTGGCTECREEFRSLISEVSLADTAVHRNKRFVPKENSSPLSLNSQGSLHEMHHERLGPRGPRGPAGRPGSQGPHGETGSIGPVGPMGMKGDKGDSGLTVDEVATIATQVCQNILDARQGVASPFQAKKVRRMKHKAGRKEEQDHLLYENGHDSESTRGGRVST